MIFLRSNFRSTRNRGGFTAVDLIALLAAVFLIVALVGLILPMFGRRHGHSRPISNSTQLRGIQQGLVTFAQSNKKGGNDGYFPGTGHSGDGTQPGARLWLMLQGNFFTPEYMINPSDSRAREAQADPTSGDMEPITAEHYSYAMLGIAEALNMTDEDGFVAGDDTRALEWKETLNTSAIVLSDRAIGTGRKDISSVWTEAGSGE